jgi:hypothetical protein
MPNPVSALNKIKNMFSPLERTIIAHKMETMPSSQWAAYIKANAPKAAKKEALAIKLDELLARQPKVSKADIVKHIQEKSPKVNVIEKGDMKLNAAESKELDELKQKASKYMFGDDAAITDDEFLRYNTLASRYDNSTVSGLNQKSESYFNSARKAKEKGNWSDELFDNRQGEFYKRRADALNAAPVDGNKTKFDTYTLPGGENYKEVILSLPQKPMSFEEWHNYNMPGARNPDRYREDYERYLANPDVMSSKETFKSGHYEEPNILAHLRMNERPTAEGKRALFLEELQSDWAQQGRKEGFLTPDLHVERRAEIKAEMDALAKEATAMRERGESPVDIRQRMRQLDDALRDIPTPKGVPSGPYVGDTADWTGLGLKKAIERAVEQGHDSIAWTSGAQQAKRYDLSKDINEVHYSGSNLKAYDHDGNEVVSQTGISPEDLPEYIGKDAAEKLLAQQPQGTLRSLRGQDLQVGGEGMRGYYDQIVPSTANDILKSMGVTERVKPIYMNKELQSPRAGTNYQIVDNTGQLHNTERYPEDAQKYIDQQMSNPHFIDKGLTLSINPIEAKYKYTDPQMGFDITPEIRDYVMNQGLPAFAGGGVVKGAANLAKKYLTPLSEKEFYKTYVAQHKDIRNVTPEDRAAAAQAILESGFNKGVNVNALPVDRGGPARNVIDKRYGNKAGDRVYLLPKEGVLEGGNGLITAEGYKPTPMQVLDISVDREPSYEAYLRNFTKEYAEGGAVHMDEGGLNVRASGNYGRFDSENASGSHYKVNTDIDILNKYGFGVTKEGDVFKLPERTYTYEDGYTETVPARKFKQSNINDIRARYTTDEGVQYGVGRQPLAKGWSGYRFDPSSQSTIGVNVSPYYKGINYTKNFAEGGKVSDPFANLSMMDKAKLLAKAAKYRIQYNKQAVEHGKYPDALSSELKKNYLDDLGNSRVDRSPLDVALNYGGGYDFGVRQDIPADVARDMGKAYQYTDYFFSPFTGPKSDAIGDYYENMAGVEAGIKERGRRATEAEIQRRSAEYGRGASKMLPQYEEPEYAEGGAVETDDFDYDEMYEFKKDEPAFAEGGEVDYDAMYEFKDNTVGFAKGGPVLSVGRGEKLPVSKGAGLTAMGRAKYNAATGSNLKAPAPHPKTDADAGRRKSFCARMSGMPGPMKDEQGNPTRKAASLKRWNC